MPFTPLDRAAWTATATTAHTAHPASHAIDGDPATYWWTGTNIPQSIHIDCGSPQTFNCVSIQPANWGDWPRACSVYVSDDGISWGAAVASKAGLADSPAPKYIDFAAVTKRYFRVTITQSSGGWSQIGEVNAGDLTPADTITETQAIVEQVFEPVTPVRGTQIILEVVQEPPPAGQLRETQAPLEHIYDRPNWIRHTQAALEVILPPTGHRAVKPLRNYAYIGALARTDAGTLPMVEGNGVFASQVALEVLIPAEFWPWPS